jgi:cysteine synthase A
MTPIHASVLSTIGNTPVIRLNALAPEGVELFVKVESFNPGGSVKDRLALGIIEAAERDGSLAPGQTVIEATSGNTGIGLAIVCAAKGYPLVVVMAESFSVERRKLLRMLGAKVVLTPASEKGTGMLAKAQELAEAHGWFFARQFENEAGPDIHSATTAEEILSSFADAPLDYFVTGFGTGGTLKGVARVLKARSPSTRVIAAEPENAQLLGSGIGQDYHADGSPASSHPVFRPHPMQGWTPDFIPKLAGDVTTAGHVDAVQPVRGDDAIRCARDLARKEGLLVGITAGATVAAAIWVAQTAPAGARILAMTPDTGARYLSPPLFDGIEVAMDAEETAIAASTPRFRFDAGPIQTAPAATRPVTLDPEAVAQFETMISDPDQPVVIFAMEWCEFAWGVKRLFTTLGVPFRAVHLDGPEFDDPRWATKVRRAMSDRAGAATIPQIFIGGRHVGGATETFDASNDGSLKALLAGVGIDVAPESQDDAYGFLPKWLHPRGTAATANHEAA